MVLSDTTIEKQIMQKTYRRPENMKLNFLESIRISRFPKMSFHLEIFVMNLLIRTITLKKPVDDQRPTFFTRLAINSEKLR